MIAGSALLVAGLACLVLGVVAGRVAQPGPVQLDPDGTTALPRTSALQHGWVVFGRVDDPRRLPDVAEIGCRLDGIRLPAQPSDMTRYGARVLDQVPVDALLVIGRTGEGATLTCVDAQDHAPLWVAPSSEAPAFAPTGIAVLGGALLVLGALVHPWSTELPARRRRERPRP